MVHFRLAELERDVGLGAVLRLKLQVRVRQDHGVVSVVGLTVQYSLALSINNQANAAMVIISIASLLGRRCEALACSVSARHPTPRSLF